MEDVKASKQIINFVVPFTFNNPYQSVCDKLDKSREWDEIMSSQRENMMEHIDILIRSDPQTDHRETIGRHYQLNQNGRVVHGLLQKHNGIYTFHHTNKDKKGVTFQFSILSIRLFTFETNVGFVTFSIKYEKNPTIDEIIDNNYYLKNFSKHYGKISYQLANSERINNYLKKNNIEMDKKIMGQALKNGETLKDVIKGMAELDTKIDYSHLDEEEMDRLENRFEEKPLSLLTRELVEQLEPVTFFNDFQKDYRSEMEKGADEENKENDKKNLPNYPSYALTYTALTMNKQFLNYKSSQQKDFIKKTLFKMRRTYKDSYKPCERDLELDNTEQVYQAFENSYWSFSLEGLANLSYLVEDEKTNRFFKSNYYGNLERSYFYLFIIALHQRYALIKLSKEATLLPISVNGLVKDKRNQIDSLREKIAYFNLRSAFKHVSYISHQDKIYQYFYHALQIDDLMTKIDSELESLGALVALQKESRHKRREGLYVGLTIIFAIISTMSAVWTLYKDFWKVDYQRPIFYATAFLILIVGFTVIFFRDFLLKERKKE